MLISFMFAHQPMVLMQWFLPVVVVASAIGGPLPELRSPVFNIHNFGAVGDGVAKDTDAIVAAIAAVADAGGGTVYFPAGRWLSAPFNLTSRCTLYLDPAATLLGSQDIADYDVIPSLPSYGQGRDHLGPRRASLIGGQNLTDVVITGGNGTIDGQGQIWWSRHKSGEEKYTRGHLIELMWSTNIEMSNLTLTNSPFWTVHPVYCRGFHAHHLTIINPLSASVAPNTDGIDPDSTSDVLIEHCSIATGDDCIAIKSGWDEFGYEYGVPSQNITIRDLVCTTPSSAGVCIGSEMSGGVSDVLVQRARFFDTSTGLRLKTGKGRGGYIRDIRMEDVTMTRTETAFDIDCFYGGHPFGWNANAIPDVRRVTIVNVSGTDCPHVARLDGLKENPMADIVFQNVHFDSGIYECSQVSGSYSDMSPEPCSAIQPISGVTIV